HDSAVGHQAPSESRSAKAMLPPAQEPVGVPLPNGRGSESGRDSVVGHQVINSTHATLAYQIDQPGPSGVGRVDVWLTQDKGRTRQASLPVSVPRSGACRCPEALTTTAASAGPCRPASAS